MGKQLRQRRICGGLRGTILEKEGFFPFVDIQPCAAESAFLQCHEQSLRVD